MKEDSGVVASASSSVSTPAKKKGDKSFFSSVSAWFGCLLSAESKESTKPKEPQPPRRRMLLAAVGSKSDELERVFRYFDENGDGKISASELQRCMRTMGEELSDEDATAMLESADADGDGLLGFEDFVKLVDAEEEEEEEKGRSLWEAFRVYEMEGEGCITPKSLRTALGRLGESKSIEECKVMIRRFDINGDGVISFDEFRIMML